MSWHDTHRSSDHMVEAYIRLPNALATFKLNFIICQFYPDCCLMELTLVVQKLAAVYVSLTVVSTGETWGYRS